MGPARRGSWRIHGLVITNTGCMSASKTTFDFTPLDPKLIKHPNQIILDDRQWLRACRRDAEKTFEKHRLNSFWTSTSFCLCFCQLCICLFGYVCFLRLLSLCPPCLNTFSSRMAERLRPRRLHRSRARCKVIRSSIVGWTNLVRTQLGSI